MPYSRCLSLGSPAGAPHQAEPRDSWRAKLLTGPQGSASRPTADGQWICGDKQVYSTGIFIYLFIYLFMAGLSPRCCVQAFSSCVQWGLLFVAVHGLLIVVASLAAEHGL